MRSLETIRCSRCRRIICRCYLPAGSVLEHICKCNAVTIVHIAESVDVRETASTIVREMALMTARG